MPPWTLRGSQSPRSRLVIRIYYDRKKVIGKGAQAPQRCTRGRPLRMRLPPRDRLVCNFKRHGGIRRASAQSSKIVILPRFPLYLLTENQRIGSGNPKFHIKIPFWNSILNFHAKLFELQPREQIKRRCRQCQLRSASCPKSTSSHHVLSVALNDPWTKEK